MAVEEEGTQRARIGRAMPAVFPGASESSGCASAAVVEGVFCEWGSSKTLADPSHSSRARGEVSWRRRLLLDRAPAAMTAMTATTRAAMAVTFPPVRKLQKKLSGGGRGLAVRHPPRRSDLRRAVVRRLSWEVFLGEKPAARFPGEGSSPSD